MNAYCPLSGTDTDRVDNRDMAEADHTSRRSTAMRLLAAALAGAIGAFGVPAGVHAAQQQTAAVGPPPSATVSDGKPD